jgi:hypothetical protein
MTLVSDHPDMPNPKPGGVETLPAGRVRQIIRRIGRAMSVTSFGDGLRGRPLSTIPAVDDTGRPRGAEAHDVVALGVDPGHAGVRDGQGLLRGIANIVKGAVKGRSPDPGTRGEADL